MGQKDVCRLCYYETTDMVHIFDRNKPDLDYPTKINRYLYLQVVEGDEFPQKICWMCSQHLETFHNFYKKINEIQQRSLKDKYDQVVIDFDFKKHSIERDLNINDIDKNSLHDEIEELLTKKDAIQSEDELDILISNDGEILLEFKEHIVQPTKLEPLNEVHQPEESVVVIQNVETIYGNQETSLQLFEKTGENESKELVVLSKDNNEIDESCNIESNTEPIKIENTQRRTTRQQTKSLLTTASWTDTSVLEKSTSKKTKKIKTLRKSSKAASVQETHKLLDNIPGKSLNPVRKRREIKKTVKKINFKNNECHDEEEESGESDDDFPSRDSDNDEYPTLSSISKVDKIIEDGLLLVKGKKLMSMIAKFFVLECDICDKESRKRFRVLHDLFAHYKDLHSVKGYINCCHIKLTRYPSIIMHMARHLQPEAFTCDICGYMVTRPRFLASHKQTHLPEAERPFPCDQCPRRFCWKAALQIHQISHQPSSERKLYMCHICGKAYETPGGLSTHKRFVHTDCKNGETHVCHVCAKIFATRTGLREHVTNIHQPRENHQLQCTECGKWLMNSRCLKSHMVLHSDTQLNCSQCSYTTKKKVLLQRHLVSQHSDAKPFACTICTKTYKLKRALTVHIAQHTSTSEPYACTFCDRVFTSSTNFYTHRKNVHPEQLQALKDQRLKEQQLRRIRAGIEAVSTDVRNEDEMLTEPDDDGRYVEIDQRTSMILKDAMVNAMLMDEDDDDDDSPILQNDYISYEMLQ